MYVLFKSLYLYLFILEFILKKKKKIYNVT